MIDREDTAVSSRLPGSETNANVRSGQLDPIERDGVRFPVGKEGRCIEPGSQAKGFLCASLSRFHLNIKRTRWADGVVLGGDLGDYRERKHDR